MMSRSILILFALATVSCGAAIDEEQKASILELQGNPQEGAEFYTANCERCHGPDGNGQGQGPSLQGGAYTREEIVSAVLRGPLSMPSFADEPDQDIADVTAFVEML